MDILQTRGERSFDIFCLVLENEGAVKLAGLLRTSADRPVSYTWQWVSGEDEDEDENIVAEGRRKYQSRFDCLQEALRCKPHEEPQTAELSLYFIVYSMKGKRLGRSLSHTRKLKEVVEKPEPELLKMKMSRTSTTPTTSV